MPALATGDIFYWTSGAGHIGMAYDENEVIHAQRSGNFHKEKNQQKNGGVITYMCDDTNLEIYRPPWSRLGAGADAKKTELKRVADLISQRATYGIYRAFRLWAGDSSFGPDAFQRFQKYRDRMIANRQPIIKTVTCAEAVIVTYQLSFPVSDPPFFIRLDGAHAMPSTLATWLRANGWDRIK